MFEYKEASFYTSYFQKLNDFKVIKEFEKLKDENLYVGVVEILNTIHPLVLRVEIPPTFPHMHLTFRTKSLSGYPHLIHTGNVEHGDWFCLNTPFAETAEGQLEQELSRLKEWIKHQMREDLPPHITDPDVIKALRFANAYDWENLDEMNEFKSKEILTFIGDFHSNPEDFKENKGHFHCIETKDRRYYAFHNKEFTNFEFPYIIVDEFPKSKEVCKDFLALRKQYDWDDATCKFLFPNLDVKEWFDVSSSNTTSKIYKDKFSEDEALSLINKAKEELDKDDAHIPCSTKKSEEIIPTRINNALKKILVDELNRIELQVKKYHRYNVFDSINEQYENMSDDEREEYDAEIDYWLEVGQYHLHYFVLGVRTENDIVWLVLGSNGGGEYDELIFHLGISNIHIKKRLTQTIYISLPQAINRESFFGRGMFSKVFTEKKIAIVGLGAIGSILTESLARSGIHHVGLWDNDIVEPGNICRSGYDARDLGASKVEALARKIHAINPICDTKTIVKHGHWREYYANNKQYVNGSFYNEINYNNQEDAIKQIKDYDLIIDCTGSNEMLHFLSYAVPEIPIVSLCITNHANELLCVTSCNGNPFELRKAYLSRIEQDTKNYYLEGSGCYSPTFLATNSDIASLVHLVARDLNKDIGEGRLPDTTIWSHSKRGIVADRLESYRLENYDIRMTVSSETIYDGEDIPDVFDGHLGYILGSYSKDGLLIMVTHIIEADNAENKLLDAFSTSNGIIDYIGDFAYSGSESGTYSDESLNTIACKAMDETINTCNPMLAVRNPDRSISFFLFINNKLVPFVKE